MFIVLRWYPRGVRSAKTGEDQRPRRLHVSSQLMRKSVAAYGDHVATYGVPHTMWVNA